MSWQKDTAVGFMDRWNPLSSKIPHTVFISHVLVRRKKANDTQLKVENAVYEIEKAIKEYQSKNPPQTVSVHVYICVYMHFTFLVLYFWYPSLTHAHTCLDPTR